MPFKKGESGNPIGRPKGSLNKTTQELREQITQAIEKGNPKTKGSTLLPKENTGKINIIKIKRVNTTKIIFELIAWLFFTVVPLYME